MSQFDPLPSLIVSPADTGLIYTALAPRLSYSQAKVGNAPRALAKLNKHGVPWISLLVVFIVSCIMSSPFPSWAKLVGFITSGTVLSFATGPVVVAALRRQLPDQERPFKLPGNDVLPIIGFICANLIVYWTGWETNWKLFLAVAIGYVVMILHHIFAKDKARLPDLKMRSGWWMILWMVGLVVLSLIGHYGGGLDIMGFIWGELITVIFSVVVFYVGISCRLSPAESAEAIEQTQLVDD